MKAIVISKTKSQIIVESDNKNIYSAKLKGTLRKNHIEIIVGDIVDIKIENDVCLITEVEKRKNEIIRPRISNIDDVIIVQSTIEPNFNSLLVDKMITFYSANNINVKVAITKSDLSFSKELKETIDLYKQMNFDFYLVNNELDFLQLKKDIVQKKVCFVGNSGVGKTTLINKIDPQLNLRTQTISKSLNRGKHTTSTVTMYDFNDGKIIDTPGFSTISLNLDKTKIAQLFFVNFNLEPCKFYDCLHTSKIGCKILEECKTNSLLIWRYKNYIKLIQGD